jgi:hypothetical protein
MELNKRKGNCLRYFSDADVLTQVGLYSDPNLTSNRVITDLDWSTQIP